MEILSLGHSAFLLSMAPADGGPPVRILGDPWLTDYGIGDLMGRFPRLRFDVADLGRVDAIFLSHSHTDHVDPYSLLRLWNGLGERPALLLPISLKFLGPVFTEFLPDAEITWLPDRAETEFRGLTVSAFFDPLSRGTNEDDVMLLVADNGREVFLNEADALLPLYEEEVREFVAERLDDRESAAFLTTRNELAATMGSLSAASAGERRERIGAALEAMEQEIEAIYAPLEDGSDPLWSNDRLVRLVGGQGLAFPVEIDPEWNRVLFPIRREDRVRMERQMSSAFGLRHDVEEFVPGAVHRIEGGVLAAREPAGFLTLLDDEADRRFDPDAELFAPFPVAPLRDERRTEQRERILTALNDRFLPWLVGSAVPPIERLLSDGGGSYRVRVRYGTTDGHEDIDYRIDFADLVFRPEAPAGSPDEHYWANDLEDFFDGRADEFSVFTRSTLGGRSQRFWHCLGLPFLNQDLVEWKFRLHFDRAADGGTPEEWVLPFYRAIGL